MVPRDGEIDPGREWVVAYGELQGLVDQVPPEHLRVLAATDRLYACLDATGATLSDEEYVKVKVLLSYAESLLTRYFGM